MAPLVCPVDHVHGKIVRLAIGQVHVHNEAGGGGPIAEEPSSLPRYLQSHGIDRALIPDVVVCLRGDCDSGVGGQTGRTGQ